MAASNDRNRRLGRSYRKTETYTPPPPKKRKPTGKKKGGVMAKTPTKPGAPTDADTFIDDEPAVLGAGVGSGPGESGPQHPPAEESTTAASMPPPTVPKVPDVPKETRTVKHEKPAEGSIPGAIPPLVGDGVDSAEEPAAVAGDHSSSSDSPSHSQ